MANEQMTVEDLYTNYDGEGSGGLFLKFEDDKGVKVRIASEPYIFKATFEDKKTGEISTTKKYCWTVLNRNEDGKPQIMQLPSTGYDLIAGFVRDPEWGRPDAFDITVTRKNNNGKYSYQIQGSPRRYDITDEEKVALMTVDVVKAMQERNPIMSLRDYLANGKKFYDEVDVDGSPKIKDLD